MPGEQYLDSTDGTQSIYVKHWFPCDTKASGKESKAQLLILHGYLEHCGRYEEFANHLNSHGISVVTYDFRGHGKSTTIKGKYEPEKMEAKKNAPSIRRWKEYNEDLELVASTLSPDLPTFFLGHSNGGLTLLNYLLAMSGGSGEAQTKKFNLQGAILTNPYVEASDSVPWFSLWIVHALGRFFPKLAIPANLQSEELTSCPIKQEEHRNDSLVLSHASIGWASQAMKTQANVRKLVASSSSASSISSKEGSDEATNAPTSKIPVPLLYIYSTEDKVANPKAVQWVGEQLKKHQQDDQNFDNITLVCREGEEHEVLNERKRNETYDIVTKWILEHIGKE